MLLGLSTHAVSLTPHLLAVKNAPGHAPDLQQTLPVVRSAHIIWCCGAQLQQLDLLFGHRCELDGSGLQCAQGHILAEIALQLTSATRKDGWRKTSNQCLRGEHHRLNFQTAAVHYLEEVSRLTSSLGVFSTSSEHDTKSIWVSASNIITDSCVVLPHQGFET